MPLNETNRQTLMKHIDMWMRVGLSTAPTDKAAAERGVRQAYGIVGLPAPSRILWLDSPMAGAIAAANAATAFENAYPRVWRQPQEFMTKKLWKKAEEGNCAGLWQDIQSFIGSSPLQGLRNNILMPICHQIARPPDASQSGPTSVFVKSKTRDPNVLSSNVWNSAMTTLKQGLTAPEIKRLSGNVAWDSVAEHLSKCGYGSMDAHYLGFLDYGTMMGFQLHDTGGIAAVAKSAGWWWPFKDLCIITPRPKKLCIERGLKLHKSKEMAIQYADHWGLFFVHGRAVSQEVAERSSDLSVDEIKGEQAMYSAAPSNSFDV